MSLREHYQGGVALAHNVRVWVREFVCVGGCVGGWVGVNHDIVTSLS